jgi:2,4-dienoyl-CoA reductase-like NADH-dependent reductase (Old Yellow Enzyme family)
VSLPRQLSLYNLEAAEIIKKNVSIPVIVVGGIKRLADIEDIITNNRADYVAMSRAFIVEPDIVTRFQEKIQTESSCISCNYCITGIERMPFKCFYGKVK